MSDSITPPSNLPPASPAPGTWYVDASATAVGDGSRGTPFNNLQDALELAFDDGTIKTLLVYPGTYTTSFDAGRSVGVSAFEIDHIAVRSVAGRASTFLATGVASTPPVIMREDALLEGFTILPSVNTICIDISDSGSGLFGARSVVRDVVFDAEPLSPSLAIACVIMNTNAASSTDNVIENFMVKGLWDSGLAYNTGGSRLHIRDGVIDDACRFDTTIFSTGGAFVITSPAEILIDNVHVPAAVTITDDGFQALVDGQLRLSNVSIVGAGRHGLSAGGDGVIIGSAVQVSGSTGNNINLADTAVCAIDGYPVADPLSKIVAPATTTLFIPSIAGAAVIGSGNSSITVEFPAALDGRPVTATLAEADGVITVANATWNGTGTLTIRTTANVTADRDVAWFVHTST